MVKFNESTKIRINLVELKSEMRAEVSSVELSCEVQVDS